MPAGEYKVEASFDLGPYQEPLSVTATTHIDPKAAWEHSIGGILGEGASEREVALQYTLQRLRNSIALFQAACGVYPLKLEDLVATEAPEKGIIGGSTDEKEIDPDDFQGPYLATPDGELPADPITGKREWSYNPKTGEVRSQAKGRTPNGKRYREL